MTVDDEKILSLIEQVHLSGKPQRQEPAWVRHADLFIEKRLSVSGMARILNECGYVISRQGVNDWLLRNKYEETRYLRKNKRKSALDPAKIDATVVDNLADNKSYLVHDCNKERFSVSYVDESHVAKPEQGIGIEKIVVGVEGNQALMDEGSKPARKMSDINVATRAAETMRRIVQIVDEKCNKPNTGD